MNTGCAAIPKAMILIAEHFPHVRVLVDVISTLPPLPLPFPRAQDVMGADSPSTMATIPQPLQQARAV